MARQTGVSQPTVSRIIDEDLDMKLINKPEEKHLTEAAIAKRKQRAKAFAEMVGGEKRKCILTLDEAMLSFDYTNGKTMQCYVKKKNRRKRATDFAFGFRRAISQAIHVCGWLQLESCCSVLSYTTEL